MSHGASQAVVALGVGYKVTDLTASDADVDAVEEGLEDVEDALAAEIATPTHVHA